MPSFDELVKAGGKVEEAPPAPRFDELMKAGGKVEEAPVEDPGLAAAIGHKLLSGFSKKFSDELVGKIIQAKVEPDAEGSVQWRDASSPSGTRALRTAEDVYRAGRDSERATLKGAEKHYPVASFLAEVGGDVGSDLAAAAFGVPVASGAYQALAGALSGAGGSEEQSTGGVLKDAAIGGVAGYVIPKVGGSVLKKALGALGPKAQALRALVGEQAGDGLKAGAAEVGEKLSQEQAGVLGQLAAMVERYGPEVVSSVVGGPVGPMLGLLKRLNNPTVRKLGAGAVGMGMDAAGALVGPAGDAAAVLARPLTSQATDALRPTLGGDQLGALLGGFFGGNGSQEQALADALRSSPKPTEKKRRR